MKKINSDDNLNRCSLCKKEAEDCIEVECGNNAENTLILNLCKEHSEEQERIGSEFDKKYGHIIEAMNNVRGYHGE